MVISDVKKECRRLNGSVLLQLVVPQYKVITLKHDLLIVFARSLCATPVLLCYASVDFCRISCEATTMPDDFLKSRFKDLA